jgi:hypothetical protein
VNSSHGRAVKGAGVGEEDDIGAGGGRRASEPEECAWAPEERTVV